LTTRTDLPFGNVLAKRQVIEEPSSARSTPLRLLADAALAHIRETLSASEMMKVRSSPELQARVAAIIRQAVDDENIARVSRGRLPVVGEDAPIEAWVERVFATLYGLGPIEDLLDDDSIEDIAINGPGEVYVRTFSGWQCMPVDLAADPEQLLWRVNQVISFSGKQAGPLQPIVDVQLPSGHRMNVVTMPITDPWPVVVIRRHRPVAWTLEAFVAAPVRTQHLLVRSDIPNYAAGEADGALLSGAAATYLHAAVVAGLNILVIGRTGVGKTAILSALGQKIPHDRRVLVLEDTRELKLRPDGGRPENCVYLVTRHKLLEGGIEVDMRHLIIAALRQRPDHLILGEARGPEIYDLLNAMQTGHGGNLTSIHANSLSELSQRVGAMLFQAGVDMDADRVARLIGSSFDVGVTEMQDFDGRRYILEIGEFTGEVESGMPVLHRVFEGGAAKGYRPTLVADHSIHADSLQRSGLSFEAVLDAEKKGQ
jgi:Flp pilus assembly CpaF family ATPase